MRIGPNGLWHGVRQNRLADDVALASIVTHRHPLAVTGAIAVATAVAHAVTAREIETSSFLDAVRRSVENRSGEFVSHLHQLGDWLHLDEAAALAAIVEVCHSPKVPGFGVPALAEPTVLASLYAFLRHPDDYVATIDCALRVGGDVDTIAAIAVPSAARTTELGRFPVSLLPA